MAKAKDLAALAGLAGLAYAMRNKGDSSKTDGKSGETTPSKKDADDNNTLARANREESSGLSTTKNSVVSAITSPKAASNDKAGNQGVIPPTSGMNPKPMIRRNKPAPETITTRKDPREAEAGMSRGTRTTSTAGAGRGSVNPPSVSATDARSAEAGMSRGTRTTSTAGAGRGSVNPPNVSATDPRSAESGMSRGTRTTSTAGAGRGFVNPPAPKPADPRSAEAGMSRGTRTTAPPFKGGQKGYDEAGNFMGGQRGFDEAGNPMKKGGMTKMASGGMTASRRADGIATKGKTRGKIC